MKKSLFVGLFAALAVFGLALITNPIVQAEEGGTGLTRTGGGDSDVGPKLFVSPSRFNLETVQPGDTLTETLSLFNNGDESVSFTISAETLQAQDEDHNMVWGASPSQFNRIINWVSFPQGTQFELAPDDEMDLEFVIDIPSDAPGGAQFFMLLVRLDGIVSTGAYQVESAIGVQVFSSVDGEINLSGRVISQIIPRFTFDPIIQTSASVENTGNVHFDATYKVEMFNHFTGSLSWSDEQTRLVIPEATRIIRQDWEDAPRLGIFRVVSTVTIPGSEPSILEQTVIIIPIWLLIIIALILVLLIIGIIFKVKSRNNAKRF